MTYQSFMNNYSNTMSNYGSAVNAYNNNTSPYFNYKTLTGARSDSLKEKYLEMLRSQQAEVDSKPVEREKQSMLQRIINVANIGNYASAGFSMGLVDDELGALEGLGQGLWAGLSGFIPFYKGKEDWEYSYSQVLEKAGWETDSFGGRLARGGAGLALDIALDPLTYLSGGASAVIKGSGRASISKVGKGAKKIANVEDVVKAMNMMDGTVDNIKYIDEILDATKGVGMTLDTATDIVKNSNLFKVKGKGLDVADEATKFMRQYNKIMGMGENVGKTISLSHLPLGRKIFGDMADKHIEVISRETLEAIGDKTLAPIYSTVRDSILGGRVGKLFNNKSTMYKLARDNPAEFFNDIRHLSMSKGNNAVRLGRKEIIEKNADFFNKLTPSERNEVLNVMEDPSKWNKVNKEVRFANIDEIKKTQKKIVIGEEEVRSKLTKAKRNKSYNEKRVKEIFTDVSDQKKALELLDKQRWAELKSIDASKIKNTDLLDEYIVTTRDYGLEVEERLKSTVDIKESVSKFKEYKKQKKQFDIDLEARDVLRKANSDTTFDIRFNPNAKNKGTLEGFMKDYISKEEPFKGIARGTAKKYRDSLEQFGYVGYTKSKIKDAERFASRVPGFVKVTDQFDNIRFYPPDEVIKSSGLFSEVVYDSLPEISKDKIAFVDDLSQYLFGKKGMLSSKMHDGTVDKVIDWIDEGKTQEFIINEMFRDRRNYNGVAAEMYSHIGREVGYHKWEDAFTKPMDELMSLYKKQGNKYTPQQKSKVAELMGMKVKRDGYLLLFKDVQTQDQWSKVMNEIGDEKWTRLYDDVVETFINDGLGKLPNEQIMRNDFNVVDYMEYAKKGEIPRAFHKTKIAEDFSFGTKAREMSADYLAEHHWGRQKTTADLGGKLNFAEGRYGLINTIEEKQKSSKKFIAVGESFIKDIDDEIDKLKKLSDMQLSKATDDGIKQAASTLKKIEPLEARKVRILKKAEDFKKVLDDSNITNHALKYNYFNQYVDDMGVVISDILKRDNIEFGMLEAIDQRRIIERAYKSVDKQRRFFSTQEPAEIGKAITKSFDEAKKLNKPDTLKKLQKDLAKVYKSKDNTKAILEATDFNADTIKRLDDIPNFEVLYDEFVVKHRDLYKLRSDYLSGKTPTQMSKIELVKKSPEQILEEANKVDVEYLKAVESTNLKYEANIEKLESNIDKLTKKYEASLGRFNKYSSEVDEYVQHIKEIDDALSNLESLEVYSQVRMGMDTSVFHEKLSGVLLDPDLDISPGARDAANILRQELFTFGKAEVGMGKMSDEAFEAMTMEYLPHILTDEGKEAVLKNKEVKKFIKGFGDDFGYGREFDPFAKSRKIKKITLDGEVINNPTIQQINEYFKEEMLGNKLFSENIADIYLQRATKNLDLMYDNDYMENMLELFGHDYINGPVREGFTTSMNYGMLKKHNQQIVNAHTSIDISENISSWIDDEAIYQKAVMWADEELSMSFLSKSGVQAKKKELINDFMTASIDDYMNNVLTKEVKDKMYAENLKAFYDTTGVGELVDDVALPISPLNELQIRGMRDATNTLQERYYAHIKTKYVGFDELKKSEMPDGVFDVNIAAKDLQNLIDDPRAHSIDVARAKRELKTIEKFNAIKQPQIKQVNSSIIERSNKTRQLQIQRDNNSLLNMYDKFLHFIKLNQTTVLPTFHIRNLFSNQFNNWLEIGVDAYDPKFKLQSIDAMRGHNLDDVLEIVGKDGKRSAIKWGDIISQAKQHGVLDEGMFAQELGSTAGSSGLLKGIVPGKFDPTDTKNFAPYAKGSQIGSFVEGNDRLIHFASQIKRGMGFEEAAESVNKFLFDYSDLTFFEQSVMKRIMPYYTWLRKNSALQMEQFIAKPNKYRNMFKVVGGIENTVAEDERLRDGERSDFLDDWIQLPFSFTNSMGQKEPLMWNPNLPYQDINRIPDITDPKGSLRDFLSQTSPILKLPIEMAMNKNIFFDSKIHDPDIEDKIDKETGEVIKKAPSKLGDYSRHIANQFGVVPQMAGFLEKDGVDLGLHAMKNLTGVSTTAYNVEGYKWIQSQKEESGTNLVGKFKDAVSSAGDGLANLLYNGRPIRPDERTDSLRPISQEKFDGLSDEEKLLYVPPTKDEGMYYNQKAVELEKRELEESGIVKRFVWTLLEKMDEGDRNQPFEIGNVTNVVDGDTVDVNVNGENKRVRLLLIDTPEVSHDENIPSMPYAEEARDYVSNALIDEDVRLIFDGEVEDAYGRTLAYIETTGGRDINQEVLEQGLGVYGYDMNPPYQRGSKYTMSEQQARQSNTGVWSESNYAKPQLNTRFQQNFNELATEFGQNEWMVKKRKEMDAKRDALNRMLGR